jgi:hypothetical protein
MVVNIHLVVIIESEPQLLDIPVHRLGVTVKRHDSVEVVWLDVWGGGAGRQFIAVGSSTHPKTWEYFTPQLFVLAISRIRFGEID